MSENVPPAVNVDAQSDRDLMLEMLRRAKATAPVPRRRTVTCAKCSRQYFSKSGTTTLCIECRKVRRRARSKTLKVVVVGNAKCGKTSIIRRYSEDAFGSEYKCTIGVDYSKRDIPLPLPKLKTPEELREAAARAVEQANENSSSEESPGKAAAAQALPAARGAGQRDGASRRGLGKAMLRLQIWDIAGQDRFVRLTRAFFAKARGAIVVADLTRDGTFEAAAKWKRELDEWAEHSGTPLPVVLVANKCDLLTGTREAFEAGAICERVSRECGFCSWHLTSAKESVNVEEAFLQLLHRIEGQAEVQEPPRPAGVVNLLEKTQEDFDDEHLCCY